MKKLARCFEIKGKVEAPPSKSMMLRAVAFSLLTPGGSEILNSSTCQDSLAALSVARSLGAKVSSEKDRMVISREKEPESRILDCGESGLALRMFAPVASIWTGEFVLTGSGSLMRRPVFMMEKPFRDLGVSFSSENGFPPVKIKGPLQGGSAEVDGSVSSQFLTGLLIALPLMRRDSSLKIFDLKSRPYLHMTSQFLEAQGLTISNSDDKEIFIKGNQDYHPFTYRVEGDWSAASFLLVAGAVGGEVEVAGLNLKSLQADRKILQALEKCGAEVIADNSKIKVRKKRLVSFEFDCTDCPDLFPPLVALACQCRGISRIRGVERLRYKESDRAGSLIEEFSRLGADLRLKGNMLEVECSGIKGGKVDAHNDHRIAMALALASINAAGDIFIEGSECVAKSYPGFFEDFAGIGGKVDE
ncbi:MAG: 3-phosphoshikimate 1-carboxyvinyltransferase [Acidobacteriota bacterium]